MMRTSCNRLEFLLNGAVSVPVSYACISCCRLLIASFACILLQFPAFGKQSELLESRGDTKAAEESESSDAFADLAERIMPSIVTLSSVGRGGGPWGVGTGFFVEDHGVIATNFHVIGEHREFTVELADGSIRRPTKILAIDRSRDLALLQVENTDAPPLSLGNSDDLRPGQEVLSIGNPLGYGLSVSKGVVAAVRELEFGDGRPMVQLAIPIEPGSSGSPVLDAQGEVVAVLAIKSGGSTGFGVPVGDLRALLKDQRPVSIESWLTIGMLDDEQWTTPFGGHWRQQAGIIKASGMGEGFGGRMTCLLERTIPSPPFDLEVEVRLEDESGAAGLIFESDQSNRHYGFYPTNGSLRLTCFKGPSVFDWKIIQNSASSAYLEGQWNKISVRREENGEIRCSVNGHTVFKVLDLTLRNGRVGLCKFREPGAQFRNFRIVSRLPANAISPDTRRRAIELSAPLKEAEELSSEILADLASMGSFVPQILLDRADQLELESARIRNSAERVRLLGIHRELAGLLEEDSSDDSRLLRCALLVAKLDNPHFEPEEYVDRVDRMADQIRKNISSQASSREKLEVLMEEFYAKMGFHGSSLDFHHRGNSYLTEVIDDREGLPITLALLLMEVGRRLDLDIRGLSTPGHFLALHRASEPLSNDSVLIDAFGGRLITHEEAESLTRSELSGKDLESASELEIIVRILRNLLRSAEWDGDLPASLRYLDALIAIQPDDRFHRTLRAMTLYGDEQWEKSLKDVRHLIASDRDDPTNAPLLEIERRLLDRLPE